MKKNSTLKSLVTGLAVLTIVLSATFINAQDTTYVTNIRSDAEITQYPDGATTFMSSELTHAGTTFNLQITVTPVGSPTFFVGTTGANRRWGIGDSADPDNGPTTIEGHKDEGVTIDGISVVNFNSNGTEYTEDAISDLDFNAITIRSGNGNNDNVRITVDGAVPGPFDLGQLETTTTTVEFGVPFSNQEGTSFTVGDVDDVTSISLTNATPNFQNAFQVIGVSTEYTFTTIDSTMSNVANIDNSTLKLYPNPTSATVFLSEPLLDAEIIDITGRVVKINVGRTESMDVSDLLPGIYFLKGMTEEKNIYVSEFIRE